MKKIDLFLSFAIESHKILFTAIQNKYTNLCACVCLCSVFSEESLNFRYFDFFSVFGIFGVVDGP